MRDLLVFGLGGGEVTDGPSSVMAGRRLPLLSRGQGKPCSLDLCTLLSHTPVCLVSLPSAGFTPSLLQRPPHHPNPSLAVCWLSSRYLSSSPSTHPPRPLSCRLLSFPPLSLLQPFHPPVVVCWLHNLIESLLEKILHEIQDSSRTGTLSFCSNCFNSSVNNTKLNVF